MCIRSGNEYPCIKIASEEIRPEKYVHGINLKEYVFTNICFKIIAFDQNRGATGKVHIRYQINDGKCIKACIIMRQRKKKTIKILKMQIHIHLILMDMK